MSRETGVPAPARREGEARVSPHIVGLAPSIMDVVARLSKNRLRRCLDLVGARPGEWRRIDAASSRLLMREVLGVDPGQVLVGGDTLLPPDVAIRPGSTVANALTVMPSRADLRRSFVSTVGTRDGRLDPLSEAFRSAMAAVGIEHHAVPVTGDNPVVFVLSGHDDAERALAMFPGVADDLVEFDLDGLAPTLLLVDVYNLGHHPFGRYLDRVVTGRRHQVVLSLGNHTVLTGDRADQVRRYLDEGFLTGLCGNTLEYAALYGDVGAAADRVRAALDRVEDKVPYALVTMGADGMGVAWNGRRERVAAVPLLDEEIVNTSGAGDAAAGIFAFGIASGNPPPETLRQAALAATSALRRF
ncbi:carbohydrate kinase family protein [Micromonospora tulbaghiae]